MPRTQELDVYRSDDFEETIEKEGFHISPIGALSISLSFMAIIPIVLYPERNPTMDIIVLLFIVGFAAMRNAEVSTVLEFDTMWDVLWWSIPLGAIIAIVEIWAAQLSAGALINIAISDTTMAILVVSVGAVGEEMLRAGIYIPAREWLRSAGLPTAFAVFVGLTLSSVIFSFQHMFVYDTWNIFFALLLGGFMYGAALEYKKDLSVPIIAHLVVNWSGFRTEALSFLMANPLLIILLIIVSIAFIAIKLWV